ncbi:adenosylcobinamide-GDP ribazoletransferase [Paracoccus ravus]|uniref:adenosylcobinamide-GDP ribazoletransferase n=1 Tax=Paracoccus ravus TaxID=2447760 RepID=UPI001FD6CE23|nr:adenosylcobinamide-GDP ribazoletransferase [Paracoccus ravus]
MARLARDLVLATVWLTRLPVMRQAPPEPVPLSVAAWAFPLVGIVVVPPAAAVIWLALWLGLGAPIAAILALGAMALVTGGLHEDGLADFADGCGGSTRTRRLEIMRDSRIGSYGALTLGLVAALRIAALAALAGHSAGLAALGLLAAAAWSRGLMALALAVMPAARPEGLGRAAGQASHRIALVAITLGAMLVLPAVSAAGSGSLGWLMVASVGAAFAAIPAVMALSKLGGQTGDVLGAIQQSGETATLLALVALASGPAA